MERAIVHRYTDPADAIWLNAARRLGITVKRASDAYAAYDGRGQLTIAQPAQLDPDDCIAQIVLHELCHALVAGDNALETTDWGLCNQDSRDLRAEHATHRVQAALADRYGLRALMAVTTEHRAHWDALPDDPLARSDDPAQQPSVDLAVAAWLRSRKTPWRNVLQDALAATAAIANAVRASSPTDSLWSHTLPAHPTGFALHRNPTRHCHDCAWHMQAGPGKPSSRCRQTLRGPATVAQKIDPAGRACDRWESRLDNGDACAPCGACCREGFDLVHVRPKERAARVLAVHLQRTAYGLSLPRPGGLCVALDGERATNGPYRCRVYEDRPRACADFALAGDACLEARRRVGLSR
jgi:hypothetical protein